MSGYQDSNLGPPAPKAGALTGLRYIPSNYLFRIGFAISWGKDILFFLFTQSFAHFFIEKYLGLAARQALMVFSTI